MLHHVFLNAQNIGLELREVGLNPPTFTCIPIAKGKELKIYRKGGNSRFPFNFSFFSNFF